MKFTNVLKCAKIPLEGKIMNLGGIYKKTKIKIVPKPQTKPYLKLAKLGIGFLALFILFPSLVAARTFNPHNIITDQELLNKNSLSKTAIQKFLERENSVLSRYSQIVDGQAKTSAQIIWEVSQKHNVNPKFLLTNLEKEQGLIQKSQATEKALDWAMGYSCYGGSCNEKHRGFYNQIEASAETQQIYLAKAGQFAFVTGKETVTFDGYKVTPQNNATTNLYIYTPYVGNAPELGINSRFGANKLFWRIWQRYFSNQKFLDGQVVTFNGSYYLIENNYKRKFVTKNLFLKDYKESDAINISSKDLNAYPDGPPVNFANNTLVKSSASGQIFLLVGNIKRPVLNNSALALLSDFTIAITESDVPSVADSLISSYTLGSSIDATTVYPQGKLFKDSSGQIWQIKDGLKHAVDPIVWQHNFGSETPESISSVENYPTGEPVKLKDGTFVTTGGKYYLISQTRRMKIDDLTIFNRVFGLSKKNSALSVSTALLDIHPAGEMIDYIDDTILDLPPPTASTAVSGTYTGTFESLNPEALILFNGQSQSVTVNFKNVGNTNWQKGSVWLKVTDKGSDSSSFGAPDKVELNESSVSASQLASFSFSLTAPTDQAGLLNQEFTLMYNKNGTPTKITSVGKFIIVKSGISAQIVDHNIPIAVRNDWRPIEIKINLQNTSPDTAWLSRRTALELYSLDGTASPFYDPNDWVRREVVGVPLNKTTIEPGETGEFIFTLDPRGITAGNYILNFQLKLLDKEEDVFINGQKQWHREIRVD